MSDPVVVEGIAHEVDEPDRRLVSVPGQSVQVGLGAVAYLSDEEFDRNLELLKTGLARAKRIQAALLEPGVDYGTVPGVKTPFLHKPGAEKFEKAYGYAISYAVERKTGDGESTPALEYIVHAYVHLSDTSGPIIAEGVGSANTHEAKYRYRRGELSCPDCGQPTIIKGKADGKLQGRYWCASFKGGCGHSFEQDDTRLTQQSVGQVENENPYDQANTILKMARKRAGVDAILTATGTSGLFTQDADTAGLDEQPAGGEQPPNTQSQTAAAPAAGRQGSAPAQAQAGNGRSPEPTGTPAPTRLTASANEVPRMPSGELTAETSMGRIRWSGLPVELGKGSPIDGRLRQTPQGSTLGFRVKVGNRNCQVVAMGGMAVSLNDEFGGQPEALVGITVSVAGELFAVPWQQDDGKKMPPFLRVYPDVIASSNWRVPPKPAHTASAELAPKTAEEDDEDDSGPSEPAQPTEEPARARLLAEFMVKMAEKQVDPIYADQLAGQMYGKPVDGLSESNLEALGHQLFDDLPW